MYRGMKSIKPYNLTTLFPAHLSKCTCWCQSRVYHWAVHRIHAHVALSVLALLLERVIEKACGDTWRNIRDDLQQIKLAQLLSPHGEVWQVTEPSPEAVKHLKCLALKNPPTIVHLT